MKHSSLSGDSWCLCFGLGWQQQQQANCMQLHVWLLASIWSLLAAGAALLIGTGSHVCGPWHGGGG
jgi:hypothetical protein